jgi:hypothetical protein
MSPIGPFVSMPAPMAREVPSSQDQRVLSATPDRRDAHCEHHGQRRASISRIHARFPSMDKQGRTNKANRMEGSCSPIQDAGTA